MRNAEKQIVEMVVALTLAQRLRYTATRIALAVFDARLYIGVRRIDEPA